MGRNKFSERMGYSVPKAIQVEKIDDELRISMWNLIYTTNTAFIRDTTEKFFFRRTLWIRYFYRPADELTEVRFNNLLKEYIKKEKWNKIYDLIEDIIDYLDSNHNDLKNTFILALNAELEKHNAAYRYVGGEIIQITDKEEIKEIDNALKNTSERFEVVNTHISIALKHLSDREKPDYRNSIKESISALESLCKQISGDPNADLGKALAKIEKEGKLKLHTALKTGFTRLYDYTSDVGVRHGMKKDPNLDIEDARYMLVTCSAFINYLIVKADKAGIF